MENGDSNKIDNLISKRVYLISELNNIINESIYYRTHSDEFHSCVKIEIPLIGLTEIRQKIV